MGIKKKLTHFWHGAVGTEVVVFRYGMQLSVRFILRHMVTTAILSNYAV